jgi:ferredoxin
MKVRVAPDLCCGAQRCAEVAPQVYKVADGFNVWAADGAEHPVPADLEAIAVRGARACPESAIKIIEE